MVNRLLDPLLHLHGPVVYVIVGLLVFGEAAVMLGFVLPGETAVLLGGVLASEHHVSLWILMACVVVAAVAGDSVGYVVGARYGRRLLEVRFLRTRRGPVTVATTQLERRGALAVFVARFGAFLRAVVPGLAGMSDMPYRTFLVANALGGIVWGIGFSLLGFAVGSAYRRVEQYAGWASDVLIAAVVVLVAALWLRSRRRERAAPGGNGASAAGKVAEPG